MFINSQELYLLKYTKQICLVYKINFNAVKMRQSSLQELEVQVAFSDLDAVG